MRPIGTFAAIYRVCMKCRRLEVRQWQSTISKPFFAAEQGRGPIDLIWKIATRAESAVAEGKVFGGFLWDLEKCMTKSDTCAP